uniref:CHAT domain-containing protein n=1 Tax=Caenorhabditis tropicalis TaxID=1561998 RepID=A0A1I7TVT2_9PELO
MLLVRTISEFELYHSAEYADGAIDIAKGCLTIGSFIFSEAAPVLEGLSGFGSFVQFLMGLVPDKRPDPMVEKLKEFERILCAVETKMSGQFAELKSFITESEFNGDVITETLILMRLMRDCLKLQSQNAMDRFQGAYQRNSPLKLAYMMISLLEQEPTNPLRMAMDLEKGKKKSTFKRWEDVIRGLLGKLLFIEGFASGLFKNQNSYDFNRLFDRSKQMFSVVDSWKLEYQKDRGYWEELRDELRSYPNISAGISNADKAEIIKKRLEDYWTTDVFYVIVYNSYHSDNENHVYFGKYAEDRVHYFPDVGNSNIFICWARRRDDLAESAKKTDDEVYRYMGLTYNMDVVIPPELKDRKFINGPFYLLIGGLEEVIIWVNCPDLEKGPGGITPGMYFGGSDDYKRRLLVLTW